ncbi:MAG: Asp-tRNA(Asn)/Glu-tRNA(Gln) amidotransferase subunit GatA [Candidatus Vogelbacteria bacterium]|nr:Asp-tRNA(Asn)/Glu-tRNA(Gln) amidotransferase subunit GatA [Candidatus Vogelbacteria bacterium]
MTDLKSLSIKKARELLDTKQVSALELTDYYLRNTGTLNKDLNAYLELFEDSRDAARAADQRISVGKIAGILDGIPLAIKDNILIDGKICSASSKILENYRAVYDATVIKKLKKEGAVFLGRTNMDEFAMGSSTENSAYGVTKNPVDKTRVPGGSSGGSAAAVAADMALASLGSDTGGSVRQPASLCGIVGLKTTYGSVSRNGLMAMGSSLDQIGPLARTVEDAEIIFEAIRGHDPMDSTSRYYPTNMEAIHKVIGVPRGFVGEGMAPDVLKVFNDTIDKLENAGYEMVDIELPNMKYALAVYYVIMPAEVSTNLARFDGVRYGLHIDGKDLMEDYLKSRATGFGKESRRRILLGTYVLSAGYYDAYYKKAEAVRAMIRQDFTDVFTGINAVSAIITPTTLSPAFKIGEKTKDPLSMYLEDIFTVSANVVGVPAISVPSGFVEREGVNLPLGIQIMAPHFREDILFKIGKDIEKNN